MSSPKIFQIWTALVKRDDQVIYDQRPIVIWGFQGDKVIALKCTTNLNTNIAHLTLNKKYAGLKEDTVVELKRFYLIPKTKLLKYRGNLSFENKLDLIGRLDRNFPKEVIIQEKLILDEALFEDYNELTEAKKKRKNKKVSQIKAGEAIFKSVKDMQKWVKKRQKGMSPWGMFNTNAGNVPLSNSIFNSTFSSDGSSGVGTSEGGISNGGLSVGSGDAGGGMGESFNPDLKLNLHYTKSLSDYLTSAEQEFIRNNMDLIDSERWLELRDKANNNFYTESTKAIFKFLADGLGYDFKYFEELLKLK